MVCVRTKYYENYNYHRQHRILSCIVLFMRSCMYAVMRTCDVCSYTKSTNQHIIQLYIHTKMCTCRKPSAGWSFVREYCRIYHRDTERIFFVYEFFEALHIFHLASTVWVVVYVHFYYVRILENEYVQLDIIRFVNFLSVTSTSFKKELRAGRAHWIISASGRFYDSYKFYPFRHRRAMTW